MKDDLFAYLKWRGDIDFNASPLNSVDALIFCQLAYLDFSGIVSDTPGEKKSLIEVYEEFIVNDFDSRKNLGLLINPKTIDLLSECAKTKRFGGIFLSGYENKYSQSMEEQFSAVTFSIQISDGNFNFVAFRGTDDTLTGWKEDFNLALKEKVPAQQDAKNYLQRASDFYSEEELFCGGHSKGGNIAIYAAADLSQENQHPLKQVFNFDGPGFQKEILDSDKFVSVLKKTKSFYPQGSIVGMLFEHGKNYSVVKSDGILVMQHDPFTWGTDACNFELCPELDKSSLFLNSTFNEWFAGLSEEKRTEFIETFFGILEATKAETNSQLVENWHKNSGRIIKAIVKMDGDVRLSTLGTLGKFFRLAGQNIGNL